VSAWRRKALEALPEYRTELTSRWGFSVYSLFIEVLLPMVREAHDAGNDDLLGRLYGYAAWCHEQPGKEPSNAVGVAFYEHLFDGGDRRALDWLAPQTVRDVWGLYELMLPPDELCDLRRRAVARGIEGLPPLPPAPPKAGPAKPSVPHRSGP